LAKCFQVDEETESRFKKRQYAGLTLLRGTDPAPESHARLLRLEARIEHLLEAVRDARIQFGSELYAVCLTVYELSGRPLLGAGMKTGRATLSRRFKKAKGTAPETPTPEPES
jgi:hypothetical protein